MLHTHDIQGQRGALHDRSGPVNRVNRRHTRKIVVTVPNQNLGDRQIGRRGRISLGDSAASSFTSLPVFNRHSSVLLRSRADLGDQPVQHEPMIEAGGHERLIGLQGGFHHGTQAFQPETGRGLQ